MKDDRESPDPDIELNGSLRASKWFIGILEGKDIEDMATFNQLKHAKLAQRFLEQDSSPATLLEALQMAEFYGVPQFQRFLFNETLPAINKKGSIYALASFVVAMRVRKLDLAKCALEHVQSIQYPEDFDLEMAEAMGLEVWKRLVKARCTYLTSSPSHAIYGYAALARHIEL